MFDVVKVYLRLVCFGDHVECICRCVSGTVYAVLLPLLLRSVWVHLLLRTDRLLNCASQWHTVYRYRPPAGSFLQVTARTVPFSAVFDPV